MSCTQNPGTHQPDKQSFLSIQNSTVGEICLWTSRFHWPAQIHIWAIPWASSVPFTQSQSLFLRSTLILPFSLIIPTMLNVKIFRITITHVPFMLVQIYWKYSKYMKTCCTWEILPEGEKYYSKEHQFLLSLPSITRNVNLIRYAQCMEQHIYNAVRKSQWQVRNIYMKFWYRCTYSF